VRRRLREGSIRLFKEQVLRIARCQFSLQWREKDTSGNEVTNVTDARIVEGMALWRGIEDTTKWAGAIELSERFHEHLREHAVSLDQRAIARLAGYSLGLDLYTLFAYRLPRLSAPVTLRWEQLAGQLGADCSTKHLAARIREPPRLCRRPVGLGHAARAGASMWAW
jgi:hypothetical protein